MKQLESGAGCDDAVQDDGGPKYMPSTEDSDPIVSALKTVLKCKEVTGGLSLRLYQLFLESFFRSFSLGNFGAQFRQQDKSLEHTHRSACCDRLRDCCTIIRCTSVRWRSVVAPAILPRMCIHKATQGGWCVVLRIVHGSVIGTTAQLKGLEARSTPPPIEWSYTLQ